MRKEERMEKLKARLEELKKPEAALRGQGYRWIAGVDEAGRGPLAGPVVAAAVVLPEDFWVLGVDDSKKLTEKKREALFEEIKTHALGYGVGMADHRLIDEINILQATKVAMGRAVAALQQQLRERWKLPEGTAAPDYILLDAMTIDRLPIPQEPVIRGDGKVLAIAAASILAKVARDRMMVSYAQEFPGYGFEKNKGYGTKAHYQGIAAQGVCPIHRRTFLKNVLK